MRGGSVTYFLRLYCTGPVKLDNTNNDNNNSNNLNTKFFLQAFEGSNHSFERTLPIYEHI